MGTPASAAVAPPQTLPADFAGFDQPHSKAAPKTLPANFAGFDQPKPNPVPQTGGSNNSILNALPLDAINKYAVQPFEQMAEAGSRMGTAVADFPEAMNERLYPGQQARVRATHPNLAAVGDVAQGISRGIASTAGGMVADPRNLPFLAASGPATLAKRAIGAGFGLMQAKGAVDQTKQAFNAPTPAGKAEAGTGAVINAIGALLGAHGAMHGEAPPAARPEMPAEAPAPPPRLYSAQQRAAIIDRIRQQAAQRETPPQEPAVQRPNPAEVVSRVRAQNEGKPSLQSNETNAIAPRSPHPNYDHIGIDAESGQPILQRKAAAAEAPRAARPAPPTPADIAADQARPLEERGQAAYQAGQEQERPRLAEAVAKSQEDMRRLATEAQGRIRGEGNTKPQPQAQMQQGEPTAQAGGVSETVKNQSVSDDPEKWRGLTKSWQADKGKAAPAGKFKDYDLHDSPTATADHREITATNRAGEVVGKTFYGPSENNPDQLNGAIEVHPEHRRQGLGSAMYESAERLAGKKLEPSTPHTADAREFWNNPNRKFGQTVDQEIKAGELAGKQTQGETVVPIVTAKPGQPISEGLDKEGIANVVEPEVSPEQKAQVGKEYDHSNRTILQPTENEETNRKLALAAAPEIAQKIEGATQGLEGIKYERLRPEKKVSRVEQKAREGKPVSTIGDYGASQITFDSPEKKDAALDAIKKNFEIVGPIDDYLEKGKEGKGGYRAISIQVKAENGSTHEIQIVPKDVYSVNDESHVHYAKARDAKDKGDLETFKREQAISDRMNDEAYARFTGEQSAVSSQPSAQAEPLANRQGLSGTPDISQTGNSGAQESFPKGSRVSVSGKSGEVVYASPTMKIARVKFDEGGTKTVGLRELRNQQSAASAQPESVTKPRELATSTDVSATGKSKSEYIKQHDPLKDPVTEGHWTGKLINAKDKHEVAARLVKESPELARNVLKRIEAAPGDDPAAREAIKKALGDIVPGNSDTDVSELKKKYNIQEHKAEMVGQSVGAAKANFDEAIKHTGAEVKEGKPSEEFADKIKAAQDINLSEKESAELKAGAKNTANYQREYFKAALGNAREAWVKKVGGEEDFAFQVKRGGNTGDRYSQTDRPEKFKSRDRLYIKVPGDGHFIIENTPRTIERALKGADKGFSAPSHVSSEPKPYKAPAGTEAVRARYIKGLESELEKLNGEDSSETIQEHLDSFAADLEKARSEPDAGKRANSVRQIESIMDGLRRDLGRARPQAEIDAEIDNAKDAIKNAPEVEPKKAKAATTLAAHTPISILHPDFWKESNPLITKGVSAAAERFKRAEDAPHKDIESGLRRLDSQSKADVQSLKGVLGSAKGKPEDYQAIYHHLENPAEPLSAQQTSLLEKDVAPFMAESRRIYQKLSAGGIPVEKYVKRIVTGKPSMLERVVTRERAKVGGGSKLGKSSASLKSRTWMALEDESGTRRVVAIKGGDITEFKDGKPQSLGQLKGAETYGLKSKQQVFDREAKPLQDEMAALNQEWETINRSDSSSEAAGAQGRSRNIELKLEDLNNQLDALNQKYEEENLRAKVFVDKQGKEWRLGQATTKEIEANSDTRYYKNALVNSAMGWLELRKAERAFDFLEGVQSWPEFADIAKKLSDGSIPKDWQESKLLNFKGYAFEPHTRAVLDAYAERVSGNPPDILDKASRVVRNAILFNFMRHPQNVAVQWAVDRGVTAMLPWNVANEVRAGVKAMKAVATGNEDYVRSLDAGASLMMHGDAAEQATKLLLDHMGKELEANETLADKFGNALGYASGAKLVKAIYKFSHDVAFTSGDLAVLQAAFAREQRGIPLGEAIKQAHRTIPDYRVPAEVLGSEKVAKLLGNSKLAIFGAYHYNIVRSVSNIFKDLAVGSGEGRARAADRLAMLGLITFVVYPALDELAKRISGDKTAKFVRSGAAKLVDDIVQTYRGDKSLTQLAESIVTPNPLTKSAIEIAFNHNLETGQPIRDSAAALKDQVSQLATKGLDTFAPTQQFRQVESGRQSGTQWAEGFAGIRTNVKSPAEHFLTQANMERNPMGLPGAEEQGRRDQMRKYETKLREGAITSSDLLAEVRAGKLTFSDAVKIKKYAGQDRLAEEMKRATLPDALKAWDKMDDDEKKRTKEALASKARQLVKYLPETREQLRQKLKDALGSEKPRYQPPPRNVANYLSPSA